MSKILEKLMEIMVETEIIGNASDIDADTELISSSIIDSISILVLLSEVEKNFSIKIKEDELTAENFQTLNCLADLISRHLSFGEQSELI